MFGKLFNSQSTPSFEKAWDIHNHLLPGVDDGSPDLNTSLQAIHLLKQTGYSGATLTPHIRIDMFDNNEQDLRDEFEQLKTALAEKNICFELDLGAEYYCCDGFLKRLNDTDIELLSFGFYAQKYLLAELPHYASKERVQKLIDGCLRRNMRLILAHVERYPLITQAGGTELLTHWRKSGVLPQVNIDTLGGRRSSHLQKQARQWIKQGLIAIVGTDLHPPASHPTAYQKGWKWLHSHAPHLLSEQLSHFGTTS